MYNYKNLKEGMVLENYRDLCEVLGAVPTNSNSKKAQFKEWNRYFEYKKEGYKFIITKVYDSPQDTRKHLLLERQKSIMKITKYESMIKDLNKYINTIDEKLDLC